ncbi:hypothetical protein D6D01_09382 [Aureobasidium pullulans]|uniref:Peptidase M20 domain-containing protein 2 n=1 Tax=Aureobasidium pullulans TaxID=5580 RepID=A0A4S9K3R1_AURPU|nr:hypothetical protein D6D01_09382 [Aureobasidium pullulans]
MYALPGIGHACGHNLIAIASISAALATKHIMEKYDIPGKVVLFGTPAEEGTSDFVDSIGCSKLGRATEAAITPSISQHNNRTLWNCRDVQGRKAQSKSRPIIFSHLEISQSTLSLVQAPLQFHQTLTLTHAGGGGKIALLNAGAYAKHNVDISLISHPGITPDASLVRTSAFQAFRIEYFGLEAHAAAAPWEGINALDALITAYTSLSVLRQQTQSGDIIQGCITQGGVKPNIIHAYASGDFVVRSTTKQRLEVLKKRVDKCFKGAAVATEAKLKMTLQSRYLDHVPNVPLGRGYAKHFTALGGKLQAPEIELLTSYTQASTDQGDISHAMPSISAGFSIESVAKDGGQGGGPHTPDFTRASRTEKAHEKALMVGKALAATAIDVLTVEGYLEEIKKEFKRGREQIAEVK